MTQPSWGLHPAAEAIVVAALERTLQDSRGVTRFADDLLVSTSGRTVDWLDHLATPVAEQDLRVAGFVAVGDDRRWRHPGALLPAIVVSARPAVVIRVDSLDDFTRAVGAGSLRDRWEEPGGCFARVEIDGPVQLQAVQRWSQRVDPDVAADARSELLRATARWANRPRRLMPEDGLEHANGLARSIVDDVGSDVACTAVLQAERQYWQSRNRAGQRQHRRQDRLGLGWGNHDHHTFRSSRECFSGLIEILKALGFELRERFHAGQEAGWGAQVLEHPGTGAVVFADVDLQPDESEIDFSNGLDPGRPLGTVGAWCALHGESVLAAGMHHLAARFDFDRLEADLSALGFGFRPPFSELPYLRQAFTDAQPWPVSPDIVKRLVADGQLDADQADALVDRAPGSHLENIARRQGHKGFNQNSVSTTIRATDPRTSWRPRK